MDRCNSGCISIKILPISASEPWLHQMGITTLLSMAVTMLLSYLQNKGADDKKGIKISKDLFKTSPLFNIGSMVVCILSAVLYSLFW